MNRKHKLYSIHLLFQTALLTFSLPVFGQFAGPVGTPGTTAIHKDSSALIGWATNCEVTRGYLDISDPGAGQASYGTAISAIGQADGTDVVSLGDSGIAVLTFAEPITDENGFDFAIFENAFNDNFLELAYVEVSSDGVQYFRFPATSYTQTIDQIGPFDDVTAAFELNNLAGKYRGEYGTPFDLAELANTPGLNISAVTHVRIVDAIGSIDHTYASFDQFGTPVNDPFPTPFPSGGFDLDAVGVIHQLPAGFTQLEKSDFVIYPNPLKKGQTLSASFTGNEGKLSVATANGILIQEGKPEDVINELNLNQGIYFIRWTGEHSERVQKLVVTE